MKYMNEHKCVFYSCPHVECVVLCSFGVKLVQSWEKFIVRMFYEHVDFGLLDIQ